VVVVRPIKPPTIIFYSEPEIINIGKNSKLHWDVSDANIISIDHGIGKVALNGTKDVSPSVSTTYTLMAKNEAGSSSRSITVTAESSTSQISNKVPTIDAIESNLKSPYAVGEPILITVKAKDPNNDEISYRFMTKGPNDEEFMSLTGWSTNNEWEWTPTEDEVGNNKIRAYVRDGKHSDEGDDHFDKNFKITNATPKVNPIPVANSPPIATEVTPTSDNGQSTSQASAFNSEGLVLYSEGKYDEAIEAYNRSIELDPTFAISWCNKGKAYQAKVDTLQEPHPSQSDSTRSVMAKFSEYDKKKSYLQKMADVSFANAKMLGYTC
jgi:tetratricopeptide (TPR) repeat protein